MVTFFRAADALNCVKKPRAAKRKSPSNIKRIMVERAFDKLSYKEETSELAYYELKTFCEEKVLIRVPHKQKVRKKRRGIVLSVSLRLCSHSVHTFLP